MTIYRKKMYECDECDERFVTYRADGDTSVPQCPRCHPDLTPVTGFPHVRDSTNHKSRAMDVAQRMAENEFGLSDINDNQRAGDVAYKAPPPPNAAEFQAQMQTQAEIVQQTMGERAAMAAQNLRMSSAMQGWQPAGSTVTPRAPAPEGSSAVEQTKMLASRALNGPVQSVGAVNRPDFTG